MGRGAGWSASEWERLAKYREANMSLRAIADLEGWPLSSVKKASARMAQGQVDPSDRHRYAGRAAYEKASALFVADQHPDLSARTA